MESKLKLFVWEGKDVLENYTSGMVCALARSEEHAFEMLRRKDDTAWWALQGHPDLHGKDRRLRGISKNAIRPMEIKRPAAFVVWGE
jgi:hypothetical protein